MFAENLDGLDRSAISALSITHLNQSLNTSPGDLEGACRTVLLVMVNLG